MKTAISLLTNDNSAIIKEYKKELKQQKQIKHNIEFTQNIEWGLMEKLLQVKEEINQSKLVLVWNQVSNPVWKEIGQLEVYGLQPYRHNNHYIHEYIYKQENEQITFNVKPQIQEQSDFQKKSEQLVKPILDNLEREKQDVSGLFGRTRSFIKKVNKLVINDDIHTEKQQNFSLKKLILEPSKSDRILVRDYECEFDGLFTIQDQEGKYLQDTQFVAEQTIKQLRIYLRTEAWLESKESIQTAANKTQVLTDFNFLMRGNPWCWVKNFDEDE